MGSSTFHPLKGTFTFVPASWTVNEFFTLCGIIFFHKGVLLLAPAGSPGFPPLRLAPPAIREKIYTKKKKNNTCQVLLC